MQVYIVKGQLGIRGITPDDFAAAGLWERMKKSIASTSGRSTDLVSVASVNPIHVVVDVRVIFNHFENEESLRFSEAFDESPYEILSEEAIFALYEVQRTVCMRFSMRSLMSVVDLKLKV